MRKILLAIALALGLLAAILLIRTARFTSKQVQVQPITTITVSTNEVAEHLAAALRFQTVSNEDPEQFQPEEFSGLQEYLERTFPQAHATLSKEVVGDYSLLYTWKGSEAGLRPMVLMAHQDVVPVEPGTERLWSHAPFAGRIAEGYIWGRGALDDKASLMAIFEAVERLLEEGFQPRGTVYLAFGHDEELGGERGAAKIAALLKSRGIKPEFVLDEGGVLTDGLVPGIADPVALVGIAEKGYVSVELMVQVEGGHSSMPPPHTAVGLLCAAIANLENHPMPASLQGPVRQMFEYVGPELPLARRFVFANLWVFGNTVARQLATSPVTNALIRTTTAATMFEGSVKDNVLPVKARAVVNFRILPGDSVASVLDYVRNTVKDPRVKVQVLRGFSTEPSPVSSTDSSSFTLLSRTIRQVFPNSVVAPSLVVAATDSRYYANLADNVYRFVPLRAGPEDLRRAHGTNERVSCRDYARGINFYIQLLRNAAP